MSVDRRAVGEHHHRRAVDLNARVYSVIVLHEPVFTSRREERRDRAVCAVCGDRYPCATVRILQDDE